ncbi:MAG: hypothetical protein RL385_3976 [Pseudomonadota bacterium]|jgi:short-subunit dehydrogenase
MKSLRDRVVVITGAAGGIGSAFARDLATAGMDVVLADLDVEGMEQVAADVRARGRRCAVVRTDVSRSEELEALLTRTLAVFGACHVLINNAGVLSASPLLEATPAQWKRVVDVNLWGVLNGSRIFGRHFVERGEGHLVNVASAGGIFPTPGMTLYSTTKFAVVGFTQQLRWELADKGVGVTLVIPGLVPSNLFSHPQSGLAHVDFRAIMRVAGSAEALAQRVRKGITQNRAVVRYGREPWLFGALRLIPQSLLDPLAKRFTRSALGRLRKPPAGEH